MCSLSHKHVLHRWRISNMWRRSAEQVPEVLQRPGQLCLHRGRAFRRLPMELRSRLCEGRGKLRSNLCPLLLRCFEFHPVQAQHTLQRNLHDRNVL